jgi:hypothetical protein
MSTSSSQNRPLVLKNSRPLLIQKNIDSLANLTEKSTKKLAHERPPTAKLKQSTGTMKSDIQ